MRQMKIEDPGVARILLEPTRGRILEALREPASATEVARALSLPAPRVNHHVRRLRDAGLVRRVERRRIRNLTETRYIALAETFVIAESLTPGGPARRDLRRGRANRPLRNLVALGERMSGESLALLDEAAVSDREISAYATSLELSFADAKSRAAFLADLLEAVRGLKEHYGAREADAPEERYRTVIACYPDVGGL
jgi:DNA-binding transcriptional ArsR family regulator